MKEYEVELVNTFDLGKSTSRYFALVGEAKLAFLPYGLRLQILENEGQIFRLCFSWDVFPSTPPREIDNDVKSIATVIRTCFQHNTLKVHETNWHDY